MRRLGALLAVLGALMAQSGLAQSNQPTEITADRFVIEENRSSATFSGNVVVKQEGLTVYAETLMVRYGDGGASDLEEFEATGGVRIEQPDQTATGARAIYNPGTEIMRLVGDVEVVNASGSVRGPELIIDLARGVSEFPGQSGDGGRVTGIFNTPGQ